MYKHILVYRLRRFRSKAETKYSAQIKTICIKATLHYSKKPQTNNLKQNKTKAMWAKPEEEYHFNLKNSY